MTRRPKITIEYRGEGWPYEPSEHRDGARLCSRYVRTGCEEAPVWRVIKRSPGLVATSWFCVRHLPDEYVTQAGRVLQESFAIPPHVPQETTPAPSGGLGVGAVSRGPVGGAETAGGVTGREIPAAGTREYVWWLRGAQDEIAAVREGRTEAGQEVCELVEALAQRSRSNPDWDQVDIAAAVASMWLRPLPLRRRVVLAWRLARGRLL